MTNPTTRPPGAVGDERLLGHLRALTENVAWVLGGRPEFTGPNEHRVPSEQLLRRAQRALDLLLHADPPEQQERQPDYRCTSCGADIFGNPRQCPRCGYTVYKSVGVYDKHRTTPEPQADSVEQERCGGRGRGTGLPCHLPKGHEGDHANAAGRYAHALSPEQERPDPERVVVNLSREEAEWVNRELVCEFPGPWRIRIGAKIEAALSPDTGRLSANRRGEEMIETECRHCQADDPANAWQLNENPCFYCGGDGRLWKAGQFEDCPKCDGTGHPLQGAQTGGED